MLSTKKLKYLKSLHQRKFRQKYANFIAEGAKTASEILSDKNVEIEGIFALKEWLTENAANIKLPGEKVFEISESELKKISLLRTPNKVLLVLKQKKQGTPAALSSGISLYLDEIRDPGNMGTILRNADWFGVKWVYCSPQCVEVYNPKAVQASMGAFLRVKTQIETLDNIKKAAPGLPIYGAALDGKSIYEIEIPKAALVVIGNESFGISKETAKKLTHLIKIPRHADGRAESLNAAVATGIVLAAFRRND
ncbi:MAG TPA: RNA methyltransferase [Bacteroidetes bacterium]|nr:RNA methyltransferase [Bacteroidota bacterium]